MAKSDARQIPSIQILASGTGIDVTQERQLQKT
jgi:hypothetical protein